MRVAVLHLPHIAVLVVPVIETQLLAEPQEVTLADADDVIQVVVGPLLAREAATDGGRERPVVARVYRRDILAVFLRHRDVRVAQENLAPQKTFRFEEVIQVHGITFVEQEQLAHGHFARLDMPPVQDIVGPLVVLRMALGIIEGVTDIVADGIYAEKRGGILRKIGSGTKGNKNDNAG